MTQSYSDYIVYVDESGDHGLSRIDNNYPIFVLAFCVFQKQYYSENTVPDFQKFKFQHVGHDQLILHERDIRKDSGQFAFLKKPEMKNNFINELTDIIAKQSFTLVSTVIKKNEYIKRCDAPDNPYHVALGYGLERVFYYLRSINAIKNDTHVLVESRGKREDNELELEFRRICDRNNYENAILPFRLQFVDKKSNSTGLQLADLVARPIGLHILKPQQTNRAYDVIKTKFYSNHNGHCNGWGLKCFP